MCFGSNLFCVSVYPVAINDKFITHLLPQVPDLDALLTHVFSDLQQHPDKAEGTGQLLFEMCKGVRNMFHSNAANVGFYFWAKYLH